ncbi:zinc finger MYM-type protein 1 [Trichonephila clavipes]|nr:zinc finger MYM-type protein 1 [Trichonephila clavipes]
MTSNLFSFDRAEEECPRFMRVRRVISTLRALPRIVWLWKLNNVASSQMVVKEGCCDWKDFCLILQRYEQSQGRMECMIKWMEFYKEIKHGKAIDKDNESLNKESQKYCWIQEFCNTGFDNSVAQARLFVEKSTFQIESQFKEKRTARKKRMFGYEHIDEPIQSFEMQCRVNFFNRMIDGIIVDTECRFKALNEYFEQFGFIYDINYLNSIYISKEDLLKYYNDLGTILREGDNSDIQPFELYEELQLLKTNSLDSINDAK